MIEISICLAVVGTALLSHLMYINFPEGILRHCTPLKVVDSVYASLEDVPVTKVASELVALLKSIQATGVGKFIVAFVEITKIKRKKESVIFFMFISCLFYCTKTYKSGTD